jgi:hypothetical protein
MKGREERREGSCREGYMLERLQKIQIQLNRGLEDARMSKGKRYSKKLADVARPAITGS